MRSAIILLVGLAAVVGAIPMPPAIGQPDLMQLILNAMPEDNDILGGEMKIRPEEEVVSSSQDPAAAVQNQKPLVTQPPIGNAGQAKTQPDQEGEENALETDQSQARTQPEAQQIDEQLPPKVESINEQPEPEVEQPQPEVEQSQPEVEQPQPEVEQPQPEVEQANVQPEPYMPIADFVEVNSPVNRGTLEEMAQDIFRLFVPGYNLEESLGTGEQTSEDPIPTDTFSDMGLIHPMENTQTEEFSPEILANIEAHDGREEYYPNASFEGDAEGPTDFEPIDEDISPVNEDVIVMLREENPMDETRETPFAPNNDYLMEFTSEPITREEVSLADFFIPSPERPASEDPAVEGSPFEMVPEDGHIVNEDMAPQVKETEPLSDDYFYDEDPEAQYLTEEPVTMFHQDIPGEVDGPQGLDFQSDFLVPGEEVPSDVIHMPDVVPDGENSELGSSDAPFASDSLPVTMLPDQLMPERLNEDPIELEESSFQDSVIPVLVIESNPSPIADMREELLMMEEDVAPNGSPSDVVDIILMNNPQQNTDDMMPVIPVNGEPIISEERPLPIAEFSLDNYPTPITPDQQMPWTRDDNNHQIIFPNNEEITQVLRVLPNQFRQDPNFLAAEEPMMGEPQTPNIDREEDNESQFPVHSEITQQTPNIDMMRDIMPQFPTQPQLTQQTPNIDMMRDIMPQFPTQPALTQEIKASTNHQIIFPNNDEITEVLRVFPHQIREDPNFTQQTPNIDMMRDITPLFPTQSEISHQSPNIRIIRNNMPFQFSAQPEMAQQTPTFMSSVFPPASLGSAAHLESYQERYNEDSDINQEPNNFPENQDEALSFQPNLNNYEIYRQQHSDEMFPQHFQLQANYRQSLSGPEYRSVSKPDFSTLQQVFMPENRREQNFYPQASARPENFLQNPFENYEPFYTRNLPEVRESSQNIRNLNMPVAFDRFNQLQLNRFDHPRASRFDQPRASRFDQPRANMFDQPRSNMFDQPRASRFDQPRSDMFDQPRSDMFDQPRSNMFDQPRSNMFDQPRSNNFNQPRSKSFNQPQSQYDIEIYPTDVYFTPNDNPFVASSDKNGRQQYPTYNLPDAANFRTKYSAPYDVADYFSSESYPDTDYYSPSLLQSRYDPEFFFNNNRNIRMRGPSPPW